MKTLITHAKDNKSLASVKVILSQFKKLNMKGQPFIFEASS
jgi:hypothetical protein